MPRKDVKVKKPVPDVKAATHEMLARVAKWLEGGTAEADDVACGVPLAVRRPSPEEWRALTEARALAVAYIRKGATL